VSIRRERSEYPLAKASLDRPRNSNHNPTTKPSRRADVTFALQSRVLDELDKELKGVQMSDGLRLAIDGLTKKLRSDMADGLSALRDESPEEFFDALFAISEDIVKFSHLTRDPQLDESVFLVLVKAVSRLGRNSSTLIQDFIDQCSMLSKSPRPRSLAASL
jgi:hypothetical protein